MYCSHEAMLEIQRRLNNYGPEGIHFWIMEITII